MATIIILNVNALAESLNSTNFSARAQRWFSCYQWRQWSQLAPLAEDHKTALKSKRIVFPLTVSQPRFQNESRVCVKQDVSVPPPCQCRGPLPPKLHPGRFSWVWKIYKPTAEGYDWRKAGNTSAHHTQTAPPPTTTAGPSPTDGPPCHGETHAHVCYICEDLSVQSPVPRRVIATKTLTLHKA